MPTADPSDDNSVLISKLRHACSTYDSASKKYLSAVKELDSAMESIAIAIRELAQGEEDEVLRGKADKLCESVDKHMAGSGATGGSKSRHGSQVPSVVPRAAEDSYTFVAYMNDFTREISASIGELKEVVSNAKKAKEKFDETNKKYTKKRTSVSDMETKLARMNQGIADNPKFAQKTADRDAAKAALDAETTIYSNIYANLLKKRSQTLQRVIDGLNMYSSRYYESLSKTIST